MAIKIQNYVDSMNNNMKPYYEQVLLERAILSPIDGLKPIHRRILWAMFQHSWNSSKMHVKCAKITGAVSGEYHPHGTASIYDALVKMYQPWYVNASLIDKHGNFGSIYGDSAVAERYPEARTAKFAEDVLLSEVNKGGTDFIDNFDKSGKEPLVLPAKLPMALINGSFGIAAGYSAILPPHNLGEVIDEVIKFITGKSTQINLLPDYPTGGIICNTDQVKEAYTKGASKVVLRAKIEQDAKKHQLVLTETVFMKSLDKVITSIKEACKDQTIGGKKVPKKIEGIKNIKNSSEKGLIKVFIEVKSGYDLDLIENQLYAYTACQDTLPLNFVGVDDGSFINYSNVNGIVEDWFAYRIQTIKRIMMKRIENLQYRIHLIDGLLIALNPKNLDELLVMIRSGKSKAGIKTSIMERFGFTDVQAEHIINIKLYKINDLEVEEFKKERKELEQESKSLTAYFKGDSVVIKHIVNELKELKKKYATPRKTVCLNVVFDKKEKQEALIQDTNHTFICTTKYIKKLSTTLKVQRKGGKGNSIGKIKEGDTPIAIFNANNKDNLLLFTDSGKVYSRKAYEIEGCEIQSYGYNLSSIIGDEVLTNILMITDEEMKNPNIKIAIGSQLNKIKLVAINEFANIFQTGIIATKLNEDDVVIFAEKVDVTKENLSIIACTSQGTTINMAIDTIPEVLRPTFGSNIFDNKIIAKGEYISGISLIDESITHAFFISKNGLGKRVEMSEFPPQIRGGKGRIGIRVKDDSDEIVKVIAVESEGDLTVISNTNIISMDVTDTSILLRPAFGNTIKKLNNDEHILDVTFVRQQD